MYTDEDARASSIAASPPLFEEGTRVDCLFDDEYFRGTVDACYNSYNSYNEDENITDDYEIQQREVAVLFRVCFDDGDVRDDVPSVDMKLPLQPGSRVECLFEVRMYTQKGDDRFNPFIVTFDRASRKQKKSCWLLICRYQYSTLYRQTNT